MAAATGTGERLLSELLTELTQRVPHVLRNKVGVRVRVRGRLTELTQCVSHILRGGVRPQMRCVAPPANAH